MHITKDNAERLLFDLLEEMKVKAPSVRCVVFRLSQLSPDQKVSIDEIVLACEETVDDTNAHAFICDDGDVYILSRHITSKLFVKVLSHPTLKNLPASPSGGPASLFEIGYDSDILRTSLKTKIDKAEANKRRMETALKETIREAALNPDIRLDLLRTLDDRRSKREKPHIMIIEDDPFTQKLVMKALGPMYEVSTANCAAQAILLHIRHAPDVVFLDIGLPDVDGLDVLSRLLELDPKAYIIMLSGNGHRENVVRAIQSGAKGFIGKPFTKAKLDEYIEKCQTIFEKSQREVV